VGTAHAQGEFSPTDFLNRLESADPIIRRDARRDLALLGTVPLPWMQKVLADPTSSYRLRLGVISALSQMSEPNPGTLSSATVDVILKASTDSDKPLRDAARQYIVNHGNWELADKISDMLPRPPVEGSLEAQSTSKVSELATTEMELLCQLASREVDQYKAHRPIDEVRLEKAIAAFRKAWELRSLVPPKNRFVFAKALYGWTDALFARCEMNKSSDGRCDASLRKAADDKLQEFADAIHQVGDNSEGTRLYGIRRYQRGSSGFEVAILQARLKELGYYRGRVDGVFTEVTENAVKSFQRKFENLSDDGIVDAMTWAYLFSRK
jgi:hypothetical protein